MTIEEFNIVYSTEYTKDIINKEKYIDNIDKEQCSTAGINNKFIEDDPAFNTSSFSVGPLLQVFKYLYYLIIKSHSLKIIFYYLK